MYGAAGAELGNGDLERLVRDAEERPSGGAIFNMCRYLGVEDDDRRTINKDDAWAYFYWLIAQVAARMSREDMYGLLDSYLFPSEVDEYLAHIKLHKRKTA